MLSGFIIAFETLISIPFNNDSILLKDIVYNMKNKILNALYWVVDNKDLVLNAVWIYYSLYWDFNFDFIQQRFDLIKKV